MPSVVWSDNALSFVSAKEQLLKAYGTESPEWKFIVPRSPWWGGVWERQVRSTKSCLRKVLGKRALTCSELSTLLVEIEATINSRPLTFVGDHNYPQPLSPSHFLLNRRHLHQVKPDTLPLDRNNLVEREHVRIQLLDRFWQVLSTEYLRNLPVTVHKFYQKGDLKVGSIVLVREDNVPRMNWELGVIEKLFKSADDVVRSAVIRVSKGVKTRPIHRLHSLELEHDNVLLPDLENAVVTENNDSTMTDDNSLYTSNISETVVPNVSTRVGRVVKPIQKLDL